MIVFDDAHLAWWERSKRARTGESVARQARVRDVRQLQSPARRRAGSGFLRFFGSVELHESGPCARLFSAKLLPREQTHAGAEAGIGVLIKIDKAIDIRGKPVM